MMNSRYISLTSIEIESRTYYLMILRRIKVLIKSVYKSLFNIILHNSVKTVSPFRFYFDNTYPLKILRIIQNEPKGTKRRDNFSTTDLL